MYSSIPYYFPYHSSNCDETLVSCCSQNREGVWISSVTFLYSTLDQIYNSYLKLISRDYINK